ncbi:MAG: hypothetical protein RIC06_21850 [Cyclobacteriaceae bacterium]
MMIKAVAILIVGVGLIYSYNVDERIRYFQTPTISLLDTSDLAIELINDSVYQVKRPDDTPLYYYTLLHTGVCFDNKCRPLSIYIYWNITGRYLGFEMPDEEFLSKYDHEPFTPAEYELLDSLLANPFLPLNNYSFYDLVDTAALENPEVDGVSGATSRDVLDYVVPDAAYTTYKLWNVVYGPVQDEIMILTQNQLDDTLFSKILHSPVSADQIWAAERTGMLGDLSNQMVDLIVNFIRESEYSQSYFAIRSMTRDQLQSDYLQRELFRLIGKVEYATEDLIYDKLKEIDQLSPALIDLSISGLSSMTDMQVINLIRLYKRHKVNDPKLSIELQFLAANSDNNYLKSQISGFLENAE